eukprot:COSAG05_NODE_14930_length_383_cov_0.714789_1_plen_89_part_01
MPGGRAHQLGIPTVCCDISRISNQTRMRGRHAKLNETDAMRALLPAKALLPDLLIWKNPLDGCSVTAGLAVHSECKNASTAVPVRVSRG